MLGRELGPTEYIEFYRESDGPGPRARFDTSKRTALLREIKLSVQEPFERVVRIVSLQTETRRASFRIDGGEVVQGPYGAELFEELKAGLDADGQGNRYLLQGTVMLNADGGILGLDSIGLLEDIEEDILAYENSSLELRNIADLNDGWLEGEGVVVPPDRLEAAGAILKFLQDERQPAPTSVSATLDGAVRLEWHRADTITSIDCEDDGEIDVVSTSQGATSWIKTYSSVEDLLTTFEEIAAKL